MEIVKKKILLARDCEREKNLFALWLVATCGLHVSPATAEVQAASCGFYAGAGSAAEPLTLPVCVCVWVGNAYVCVSFVPTAPATRVYFL